MDNDYSRYHQNCANLVIHLFAVPLFVASVLVAAWFVAQGNIGLAASALLGIAVSLLAQGIGHKLEAVPPAKFDGPADLVTRIFKEQFYRFWVYLLSGAAMRSLRGEPRA